MKKPTKLQKKTLEIIKDHPEISMGEAMRRAGYSPKTAMNPKENFMEAPGTAIAIEHWRETLRGLGLTEEIIAKKHLEWLTAKKTITSLTEPDKQVPDYLTQIKAGEMLRKDFGIDKQEVQQTNVQVNNFVNEDRQKYQ